MEPLFPSMTALWRNAPYPAIDPTRAELSVNVKGKTVVVTGGGAGIGASIAHAFAKAGASRIAILGRTEKTLKASKDSIEVAFPGVTVIYEIADIVDKTAINKAFSTIVSVLGKIDICVNNAAYMPAVSAIKGADAEDWWRGYEVNVRGSFNVVQAFLPSASEHPYLINVTTGAALLPPAMTPGFSSYTTTKIVGVKLFEFVLAENPHVHVVSVHPGGVMTDMGHKAKAAGIEIPGDDIELGANFVIWSCSPEAEFLKGRMIWCNWDVDQLKARKAHIEADPMLMTTGVYGWPYQP